MHGRNLIDDEVKAIDNIGCVERNIRDIDFHDEKGMWTLR